jgi:hypothetical protein
MSPLPDLMLVFSFWVFLMLSTEKLVVSLKVIEYSILRSARVCRDHVTAVITKYKTRSKHSSVE